MGEYVRVYSIEIRLQSVEIGVYGISIINKVLDWKVNLWNIKITLIDLQYIGEEEHIDKKDKRGKWIKWVVEDVIIKTGTVITNVDIGDSIKEDKVDDEW